MLQKEPLCTTQICCYQNAHKAPVKLLPRAGHVTSRITGESKTTRTSHIHQQVLTIMKTLLFYSKLKKFLFRKTVWQVIYRYEHHYDCVTSDMQMSNTKIIVTRTAICKSLLGTQGFSSTQLSLKVRCTLKNILGNIQMVEHVPSTYVIRDAAS